MVAVILGASAIATIYVKDSSDNSNPAGLFLRTLRSLSL